MEGRTASIPELHADRHSMTSPPVAYTLRSSGQSGLRSVSHETFSQSVAVGVMDMVKLKPGTLLMSKSRDRERIRAL